MTGLSRRQLLAGSLGAAALGSLGGALPATAAPAARERISRQVIHSWAADTWASLVAMTDENTGLTADNIGASVRRPVRSGYTSPTNIGGYLWSAVVARDLGLISRRECSTGSRRRSHAPGLGPSPTQRHVLQLVRRGDRGELTTWPVDGSTVLPFLSSVDNGWLAAALIVVAQRRRAQREDGDADRCAR